MILPLIRSAALSLAIVLSLGPAPARAAPDVTASVVRQLREQGYRNIAIERTFLGRDVVTARGRTHDREIVIDPRSGVMLRDLVRQHGGAGGASLPIIGGTDDRGSDGSRRGSDDDDDDDSDDDSSGSGSGHGGSDSSGSGGGNSGSGSDDSGSDDDSDDSDSDNSGSGGGNSGRGSDSSGRGSDGGGRGRDD